MITKGEMLSILATKDESAINTAFNIGIIDFNEREQLLNTIQKDKPYMDIKIHLDNDITEQHQCIFHDNDGWCKLNHYTNDVDKDEFCDVLLRYDGCPLRLHKEITVRVDHD